MRVDLQELPPRHRHVPEVVDHWHPPNLRSFCQPLYILSHAQQLFRAVGHNNLKADKLETAPDPKIKFKTHVSMFTVRQPDNVHLGHHLASPKHQI